MNNKILGDEESLNLLKELSLKRLTLKATRDKFFERGYRNKNGVSLTVPNLAYFKKRNKLKRIVPPKLTDLELIKMVMKSDLDTKRKFHILEQLIPV